MKAKIIVLLSLFAALPQAQTGYSQGVTSALDDKTFFSGAHLGMTIDQCHKYYGRFNVGILWHSGAPQGEKQEDFRTPTFPQRRVYV